MSPSYSPPREPSVPGPPSIPVTSELTVCPSADSNILSNPLSKSLKPRTWKPSTSRKRCTTRKSFSALSLSLPGSTKYLLCTAIVIFFAWFLHFRYFIKSRAGRRSMQSHELADHLLRPITMHNSNQLRKSAETWLRQHALTSYKKADIMDVYPNRPRAAIISLVRNEELDGILQSMRQLEYRWNSRFKYPWIFFSEQPFNEEFKSATSNATTAITSYHLIPREHWSVPEWVDMDRYMDSLDYLSAISVGKGHMLSYRNMCRWNSGFFYRHPALHSFDYYWRVEPDVHFLCDIPYDPFAFMADNKLIYGFNMNILDDARSFASLWRRTLNFTREYPHLIHKDADLDWLIDQNHAGEYNNCQFFSNFEIGDLNFFRSDANEAYFRFLDDSGGFYYERFGDAPVHTLSVAMFAPKDKVWFFQDIGYQHDIARHCPLQGVQSGRCQCEPTGLDENFYKLVPMESPQRKPSDTCIRQWLGGKWLDTKDGWSQEAERALGGDGFGGYIHTGAELD